MIPFTTTKAMFARRAGRPHHQIGQPGGSPHATAAASRMTESTGEPVQPAHSLIYQTDDACLATDQPALLPPSASAATSTAMADATRMCDVALRRRGAVWESMLNAGRKG
jgi:hypothetical protein